MSQNERAEYLAETYADAILRLSYTYLKNTHDAQDICQTVFVKLLTDPREFDTADHERAYILRMAANACKDLLKSPWRKRICGLESCGEAPRRRQRTGLCWRLWRRCRSTTGPSSTFTTTRATRRRRSAKFWAFPPPRCTPAWPGAGQS